VPSERFLEITPFQDGILQDPFAANLSFTAQFSLCTFIDQVFSYRMISKHECIAHQILSNIPAPKGGENWWKNYVAINVAKSCSICRKSLCTFVEWSSSIRLIPKTDRKAKDMSKNNPARSESWSSDDSATLEMTLSRFFFVMKRVSSNVDTCSGSRTVRLRAIHLQFQWKSPW